MRRRETISPDLTPLVDVVFILLIFFIVTSVFKKEELALILDLPSSKAKELKVEQKQITLELNIKDLAYQGKKITFDKLNTILKQIKDKTKPVIVRIDKKVPYERVLKLLDILQHNSLNNLAMVSNETK
jgi:biopolymer transport protein ExbD